MTDIHSLLPGPSYDVNKHIAQVRALHAAYPLRGSEKTFAHTTALLKRVIKRLPKMPAEHMLELAAGCVTMLFEQEQVYDPPFLYRENEETPPNFHKASLHELERILDGSTQKRMERAVEDLLVYYLFNAPPGAYVEEADAQTTIPFFESVAVRPWVAQLMARGLADERDTPLFPRTYETILHNLARASGTRYDIVRKRIDGKIIGPEQSKLDGEELIETYLKGTAFHPMLVGKMPFAIPQNTRFSGQWVLAPPNRGKTNMLLAQIERDLQESASILILDGKGDLADPIKSCRAIKDRLVVLEPSLEYPLAINPLDLGASTTHTVSFIEYVFGALLDAEPTPLQSTLFRAILLLLREVPGATFADFRKILTRGIADYAQHLPKMDPEDQEFFTAHGTDKSEFDSPTYRLTKEQLLWRIRDLTTRIPILRAMFRAPKTKIDMGALMDSGKVVVLDVRKQFLGDQGTEFLGRLYIAMVRAAADQRQKRRHEDKLPCYFYIDEAHTIIARDTKLAGIIQECRSQKVAMILAHQAISQITNNVTLGALSDCAIRMANSDEETSQLAPRLRADPDMLRNLPIGTFATYVRDTTKQAVRLQIPLATLPKAPRMTRDEERELTARMRQMYAYTLPAAAPVEEPEPPPPPKWSGLAEALQAFAAEKSTPPKKPDEKW